MLTSLSIKNFALIEDLSLDFSAGLNAITGETGAGKTIILDALSLALGGKAKADQLRHGAPRLSVSADFNGPSKRLKRLLIELGLAGEKEEGVLLRREVDPSGRSRSFVNDQPVNLTTLARLGELLVDLHGQHDHQLLLKTAEQREILDTFGHLEPAREDVQAAYAHWRDLVNEKEALALSEQERTQRLDLYKFQLKELQTAKPRAGEDEELDQLLPQLKNAERLKTGATEAYDNLYGDEGGAVEKVLRAKRQVENLQALGADLGSAADMLGEALVRLEESARAIDDFQSKLDLDPSRADEVLGRMDLLARLKKKYGPSLEDVVAHQKKIEDELDRLENLEASTQDLADRLKAAETSLRSSSQKLTQGRAAAAKKFSDAVEKELRDVGLGAAHFVVAVEKGETFTASGADQVEFRFSPNPGEGLKSLAEVASGGELSRVMLALKTVLAKADPVPTLVFDEIDAGVGGATGGVVGKKLAFLGKTHQVLCITHLAAIAAQADAHFSVEKEVKKDRTHARVARLSEEDRVREVARLLGGVDASGKNPVSVQHAKALLAEARG